MPVTPETIERLRSQHSDAVEAINEAIEALSTLAASLRAAGDVRACNALHSYAIASLTAWNDGDPNQCGGISDAAQSIDALESGETED